MNGTIRIGTGRGAPAAAGAPTFCGAIIFFLAAFLFAATAIYGQANSDSAAALIPDAANRLQAIHYGLDRWNAARVDGWRDQTAGGVGEAVERAGDLQRVWRISQGDELQDRAAWISDVRTMLEKYGIGWTMWDYSGGFAVVTKQDGRPAVPDAITVKALGLKMPAMSQ